MVKQTGRIGGAGGPPRHPSPRGPAPSGPSEGQTKPLRRAAARSGAFWQDLPAHLPHLEGKPSVIQEAAWRGAEALAAKYYGYGPGRSRAADASVLSFIATAMTPQRSAVLDPATRKLLSAGFKSLGVRSTRVAALVDSLADAVAARLGYRPPLNARRLEDVQEAIELMQRGELGELLSLLGQDPEAAARKIAALMRRLLGQPEEDAADAEESEANDGTEPDERESGESHEHAKRGEDAEVGLSEVDEVFEVRERREPEDGLGVAERLVHGASTGLSAALEASDDAPESREALASEDLLRSPERPLPPPNVAASLAELHEVAPEHTPLAYKAVVEFATTLYDIVVELGAARR